MDNSTGTSPPRQYTSDPGFDAIDCPICGRPNEARLSRATGFVFCWHSNGFTSNDPRWVWRGSSNTGAEIFEPENDQAAGSVVVKPSNGKPKTAGKAKSDRFDGVAEAARIRESCSPNARMNEWLAEKLGLPLSSLGAASVRYVGPIKFAMPCVSVAGPAELKSDGFFQVRVLTQDGSSPPKPALGKYWCGQHGLVGSSFFPVGDAQDRPGPLLLPEGFTDAAVLAAAGLRVLGRPNNSAGGEHLAKYVQPLTDAGEAVILIGENDSKNDDYGPGVIGPVKCGQTMIAKGARAEAVKFVLPPGAKDVREAWKQFSGGAWDDRDQAVMEQLAEFGRKFLAECVANAEPIATWVRRLEPKYDVAALWQSTEQIEPPLSHAEASPFEIPRPLIFWRKPTRKDKQCLSRSGQVMRHRYDATRTPMIVQPPCDRLSCEGCKRRLIDVYRNTVWHHLGKLDPTAVVYACEIPGEENWKRCRAAMLQRTKRGDDSVRYLRIEPDVELGKSYTVLTCLPKCVNACAREMTPSEAAEWLIARLNFIDSFPWTAKDKSIFTHHRKWPLIDDEEPSQKSGNYARQGRLDKHVDIAQASNECGLRVRARTIGSRVIKDPVDDNGAPHADPKTVSRLADLLTGNEPSPEDMPQGGDLLGLGDALP